MMKMPYVKFYVSLVIETLITETFLRLASFNFFSSFYSTALKDFRGVVLTHGIKMGRRAGGWMGGRKNFVQAVSQKL